MSCGHREAAPPASAATDAASAAAGGKKVTTAMSPRPRGRRVTLCAAWAAMNRRGLLEPPTALLAAAPGAWAACCATDTQQKSVPRCSLDTPLLRAMLAKQRSPVLQSGRCGLRSPQALDTL